MTAALLFHKPVPAFPWVNHWVLFAVVLLLIGSPPTFATPPDGPGLELASNYRLPDDPAELLRIDDEMRAFFSARIDRKAQLPAQLDQIANAILGKEHLHFFYDAKGVYDAREAFRRRSGNCITYSILTVAVAREFGIKASFNEVRTDPKWNRDGGVVLMLRHINVRVDEWPMAYELDLILDDDLQVSGRTSEVVKDARAFAGVYSTAGVFRLAAGDLAEALLLLDKATGIDPSSVPSWNNFGCALAKAGQLDRAQVAYERALALERNGLDALSGLAAIHRAKGRYAEAGKLERIVGRYRERNPYYLLGLAQVAFSKGNLKTARRHLQLAIRIKHDEPALYQLMAEVTLGLGLEAESRRWTKLSERYES